MLAGLSDRLGFDTSQHLLCFMLAACQAEFDVVIAKTFQRSFPVTGKLGVFNRLPHCLFECPLSQYPFVVYERA